MVGQFYDNIWIYYKEVTQKYNADNRLEYGVSKDIVADAIRDFGIKLYQNNFSNEDLYTAFLGITPEGGLFPFPNITGSLPTPSGFEYINTLISASNDYIPLDDANKSLYKRIYHNLPYLLKAKGTLPGLRALITSYGIPDTILRINEYGGKDKIDSNDWDYWQNEFNYSFYTEGNNFISSSFVPINPSWNVIDDTPESLMFRFKSTLSPDYDPSSSLLVWNNVVSNWNSTPYLWNVNVPSPYSQSLWSKQFNTAHITLTYTGSGYVSGSYSGSVIDPYYQYATLTLYPSYTNNPTVSASVYLPFFDGGWWSVMVNVDTSPNPNYNFTLYAANKIYEGGDNGTLLGFIASSSVAVDGAEWVGNGNCYFASSSLINGAQYNAFSGSLQEIRYYTNPISESVFRDYTMNPSSIEGNSINSSPNELLFRASLGGELYTGSTSIHPKITGSWATTQSFVSNSNFYFYQTPIFIPNREYFFYDQPIAGIKNTISDKIRIENNVLPSGDTLSPFKSLSQMANVSQSYTQNINYLEVAFSPQNEINEDIMDQIGSFNIGEYIGDPRLRSSSAESYPALDQLRNEYFQKYTSNYNLTDFIRLIKFFDNSLFKMIRDFVPARTSLASGIVIKQHLLERNKYPQPQLEWEDLDISGTLKPTWNDYEPGTVENFSGGTGGTMDIFNSILNTSQSWYETIPTISGSVLVLHDDQDEFYDGEFSGSVILVTDGTLNEAYPIENLSFDYTPVRYSPQNYGLSSDSRFAEDQFLNSLTTPNQGEILLLRAWRDTSTFPQRSGLRYVKIHKVNNNGIDNSTSLGQATQLLIKYSTLNPYYTLQILSINEYPTYYLYQVNTLGSDTIDNYILDYKVSSSITSSQSISYFIGIGNPTGFKINPWDNILAGTNLAHYGTPYFNTSSGNYTLENTPNIPLLITASIVTSGSSNGVFGLYLNQQGTFTSLVAVSYFPGSNVTTTISASYYGLSTDQVFLAAYKTDIFSPSTLKSASLLITQSTAPSAAENDPIIIEPYITTPNFYNSDGNALLNNAFELRDSSYYMDVDYSAGLTEPVNFDSIISESATRAKVQDSNYTSKRVVIPRYLGSKSTSQQLNAWTEGDTGTFGKLPTIENLKSFVAYGYMDGSYAPERMNTSVFRIKYLIDQDGNISAPNISDVSLPTVQQNFPTGDRFRYASILGLSSGGGIENQFRNIIRGGYRIEPLLYTQIGSQPGAQWSTGSGCISFTNIIPSEIGVVPNVSGKYGKSATQTNTPLTQDIISFPNTTLGTPLTTYNTVATSAYTVTSNVLNNGINLSIGIKLLFKFNSSSPTFDGLVVQIWRKPTSGSPIMLYQKGISSNVSTGNVMQSNTTYTLYTPALGQENRNPYDPILPSDLIGEQQGFFTVPSTDLNTGDLIYVTLGTSMNSNESYSIFSNSSLIINQYPISLPSINITGNGVPSNQLWGYPDPTNYPNVITSSNSGLIEAYGNPLIKQVDISGSGFNSISLPFIVNVGDEFRFEGREDYTFEVKKIYAPQDEDDRLFPTGSIEVHFSKNLPISSSIFNLDHFLIRKYVEDSSLIIFEGFRPTGGGNPNSFIITPEYVIPQLNKNTDEFVTLLTEKGLIG